MLKLFIGAVIGVGLAIGGFFSAHQTPPTPQSYGSFSPTGGSTYRLGQSIGTSDMSFKLSSFKEPVSNILYTMSYLGSDIEYGTISPQSSISEFVSFTGITQNSDGSATLTGVIRGLTRTPAGAGCIASTTLTQPHAGQSIFILSDSPCLFSEYTPLRTNATSSAILTFSSTTPPRLDQPGAQSTGTFISTTSELATVAYVNKVAVSGSPNATVGVKGLVQLGTGGQFASSTILGSTGASLVVDSSISTSSPYTTGSWNVFTQPNAKIKQMFWDLTEAFTFSTTTSYTGNFGNIFATSTSRSFINFASTTAITATTASSTNLIASTLVTLPTNCTGCTVTAVVSTTTTVALPTAVNTTTTATVFCVAPKLISGGGFSGLQKTNSADAQVATESYPASASSWTVTIACDGAAGSCSAGTAIVYALCVNP